MIDLKKYLVDENDIEFVNDLYNIILGQSDVELCYKNFCFLIEPLGEKIHIWHNKQCVAKFENFDDLLLNYLLDGEPIIKQIKYIDYAK